MSGSLRTNGNSALAVATTGVGSEIARERMSSSFFG
jgi:hypothetical protein